MPGGNESKTMKKIAIIGAGGLGQELKAMINNMTDFKFTGFYDDEKKKDDVIGNIADLNSCHQSVNTIMGIGSPEIKASIINRLNNHHISFPTVIHSSVYRGNIESIAIGPGSIITPGCSLTTDIIIGSHVLVNLNCTIGHDVSIGNFSSIMPGSNISGNVKIGKEVLVGAGTQILQGLTIGDKAIIGAGAVVTKNVPANTIVKGVPAK